MAMTNEEKFESLKHTINRDPELRWKYSIMQKRNGFTPSEAIKELLRKYPEKFDKKENAQVPAKKPFLLIGPTRISFSTELISLVGDDTLSHVIAEVMNKNTARGNPDVDTVVITICAAVGKYIIGLPDNNMGTIHVVLIRRSHISPDIVCDIVTAQAGNSCSVPIGYYIADDNEIIRHVAEHNGIKLCAANSDGILSVCFRECADILAEYNGAVLDQRSETFIDTSKISLPISLLREFADKFDAARSTETTSAGEDYDSMRAQVVKIIDEIYGVLPKASIDKLEACGLSRTEVALLYAGMYYRNK